MPNETTSYTPAQYLEAGYRAEQGGDRDRAAQYYIYVADAFPETPEGEAARGGLVRIGAAARPEPQHAPTPQPRETTQPAAARAASAGEASDWPAGHAAHVGGGAAAQASAGYAAAARQQPQSHAATPRTAEQPATIGAARTTTQPVRPPAHDHNGHPQPQPSHQHSAPAAAAPGYAPTAAAATANQQRIVLGDLARLKLGPGASPPATQSEPAHGTHGDHAHADAAHQEPMRLPDVVTRRARELAEADAYAPPPKYRGGRLMARLFVWLGWLTVAGGIAEIVLALVFGGPANLGLGVAVAGLLGLIAIVTGLMMVLVGQLSLAVFDGSNAVREMAAIMRARSDL